MMSELVQIKPAAGRRPEWLRIKIRDTETFRDVRKLVKGLSLNTVCEEARCPNIWECWGQHRTATFMILGEICTRACRYCSVISGRPNSLPDPAEPEHVADAVETLGLKHAVVTSVDRDDLPDYGAGHFAETIWAIQRRSPDCRVEVLIPDFLGDMDILKIVLDARPDILDHNVETVPRLYRRMRPKGSYQRALDIIRTTDRYRRETGIAMTTKTGLMTGLGESMDEILTVMDDMREAGCDVFTIGQYLNPTRKHAKIDRYYTPEEFDYLREEGKKRGFLHVESGPLVRSSYHAHEHVPQQETP